MQHERKPNARHQSADFVDSIPAHYDAGLGPHLFIDFAADLAQRAASAKPTRVLEIAAGTGILTRLLRDALPGTTDLIASDLNPPMLDVAKKKFGAREKIEFRPADATVLPFENRDFDAVVCQFGVMFFPDKIEAYREVHRVLTPGGQYHFNVWDSFAFNPFVRIAQEVIDRLFATDAPAFFHTPFGYHRIDDIKTSLVEAGFEEISVHVLKIDKSIPDARRFAEGLVLGNPLVDEIRMRNTVDPETVVDTMTATLRAEFGHDPGRMPLQAIVFSSRKR